MRARRVVAALLVAGAMSLAGCAQEPAKPAGEPPAPKQASAGESPAPTGPKTAPEKAGPQVAELPAVESPVVDARRALRYLQEIVALGPRPSGSKAHAKLQSYIVRRLRAAGAQVEDDRFVVQTPKGERPMRNIIAKFPGTREGVVVLGSHYDTKELPGFVGANDGGSSTALLLELANQLKTPPGKPRDGYSVWLVFFDGEEAVGEDINPQDGLYGSRHLAKQWKEDGTAQRIKALIVADMIGDADLQVLRDLGSTPWLLDLVGRAAQQLGYQQHFYRFQSDIIDDHVPFREIGVPAADLIDFQYGYGNAFWHTKEDTLDKVSARSLEIVGNVLLRTVALLDKAK